jgi:hypothetical protein
VTEALDGEHFQTWGKSGAIRPIHGQVTTATISGRRHSRLTQITPRTHAVLHFSHHIKTICQWCGKKSTLGDLRTCLVCGSMACWTYNDGKLKMDHRNAWVAKASAAVFVARKKQHKWLTTNHVLKTWFAR